MPGPDRRATHRGRRAPAITRGQERRARASIPSNLADLPRESIDASVLMSCMMVASVSAFGKGLDSAKALLGGLQVKYNRGEAASFEESLVEESVGVLASFSDPDAPASASAAAADVEVASHFPFGQQPGPIPVHRSDTPSPPPKPVEVIDLTSPAPSPVQATSPPDEVESPAYSPASPASSPTPASATSRNYHPGAKSPEYHPGHVATTYQGHVAAPEYPGAISASIMGPLAASNMYPGGTFHGFFNHLVNLLKEVVDGIRTRADAGAALFGSDTYHSAIAVNWVVAIFGLSTPIYMPMLFARTSGSAGVLILLIIVVFMVPTVQAAPCPTCSDCLPG